MNKIIARDQKHLKQLIAKAIKENGPNSSLNFIDVSNVRDMSWMFANSKFNGDISKWRVRNNVKVAGMFRGTEKFKAKFE